MDNKIKKNIIEKFKNYLDEINYQLSYNNHCFNFYVKNTERYEKISPDAYIAFFECENLMNHHKDKYEEIMLDFFKYLNKEEESEYIKFMFQNRQKYFKNGENILDKKDNPIYFQPKKHEETGYIINLGSKSYNTKQDVNYYNEKYLLNILDKIGNFDNLKHFISKLLKNNEGTVINFLKNENDNILNSFVKEYYNENKNSFKTNTALNIENFLKQTFPEEHNRSINYNIQLELSLTFSFEKKGLLQLLNQRDRSTFKNNFSILNHDEVKSVLNISSFIFNEDNEKYDLIFKGKNLDYERTHKFFQKFIELKQVKSEDIKKDLIDFLKKYDLSQKIEKNIHSSIQKKEKPLNKI